MRPSMSIVNAYAVRGVRIWVGVRLLVSAVLFVSGFDPFTIGMGGGFEVVLLSIGVSTVDTYRHHEGAWLANLGVQPAVLCCLFGAPALLGEIAIGVARAGLR